MVQPNVNSIATFVDDGSIIRDPHSVIHKLDIVTALEQADNDVRRLVWSEVLLAKRSDQSNPVNRLWDTYELYTLLDLLQKE